VRRELGLCIYAHCGCACACLGIYLLFVCLGEFELMCLKLWIGCVMLKYLFR